MSYIKIANNTQGVNRLYLEKLGLSTKRDNEQTIGQFGSGSKFAPIAALRNSWEWINVGEDDLGSYKMQYIVQEDSGIDCIYYMYDDEVLKPSSFTVDAGVLSWDSPFQIFREAFSNALDDFTENGNSYSIDLVDEVKYEPGVFAVYLTADPSLTHIVNNFDQYFSIQRTPIVDLDYIGKIYNCSDDNTHFFYKGVLVHNEDHHPAIFDYELSSITLNEERRIRSIYDLNSKVAYLFSKLKSYDDTHVEVAEKLIKNANKQAYEWTIPSYFVDSYFHPDKDSAFVDAWKKIHGDKIAVPSNLMKYGAQFALRNHEIVEVASDFLYKILAAVGVECADTVLGDEVEYTFCALGGEYLSMYDKALSIVTEFLPDFNSIVESVKFFVPEGEQDSIYGVANLANSNMYLSMKAFSSMQTLIGTMVHEYDHISTSVGDDDLYFRNIADNHIGNLLIKLYSGGN